MKTLSIVQCIGGLLLLNAFVVAVFAAATDVKSKGVIATVCVVFAVLGIALLANRSVKIDTKFAKAEVAAGEIIETAEEIAAIKTTIEGQRATIDAAFQNAKSALETSAEARKLVDSLSNTVTEAQGALSQLRQETEFLGQVRRALSGYGEDFDKLKARSGPSGLDAEAFNAVDTVMESFSDYGVTTRKYGRLPAMFDLASVTIAEIKARLPGMHLEQQRESVMWVFEQQRFTNDAKLKFFYPLAKSDPNLKLRAIAGFCYLQTLGITDVNVLSTGVIEKDFKKRFPNEVTEQENPKK